jgi:hypothetical protein
MQEKVAMTTMLVVILAIAIILGPSIVLIIAIVREDPNCEVILPVNKVPTFPYRCVRCSSPEAYSSATFRVGYFQRGSVEVPSCEPCARKLRTRVFLRFALFWLGIGLFFLGIPVVVPWVHRAGAGADQGAAYLLLLVAVIPWLAYRLIFPLPLVLMPSRDTITYKWRSAKAAAEFAAANGVRPGPFPKHFY